MKTSESILQEMKSSTILTSNEYTFSEYAEQLSAFQTMICKMIAGNDYHEAMRVNDAICIMKNAAHKNNLLDNMTIKKATRLLQDLSREIAITMSGKAGERRLSEAMEKIERSDATIYKNVYITDGKDETELDSIALTNSGIVILEAKNAKTNIVLAEDGRMMINGEACYGKISLGDKMALKRRLLNQYLTHEISERGMNIPICIDSLIVFCPPPKKFINVDNQGCKESYCFASNLAGKIEGYTGNGSYNSDQLRELSQIISELKSGEKKFVVGINYDDFRCTLAEALALISDSENENATESCNYQSPKQSVNTKENIKPAIYKTVRKISYAAGLTIVVSAIAIAVKSNLLKW